MRKKENSTNSEYCVAKMEASSAAMEDRFSALPDSVIQHILSFLPSTREAVRTSILSKTWRRQWTHLPLLIFKPCLRPGSYLLPKFLIESESLVTLEMENCYIKSNWTVNLPSLKSLKMDARGFRVYGCNQGIENFVSGCPLLEWLELRGFIEDDVAVFSNSLKVLSFANAVIDIAIDITCPNLVELNFESSIFAEQMIENVLSSSPCVHSLKLVDCWGCDWPELVIASDSLKVLHLENVNDTEISISCPNLVKLDMLFYTNTLRNVVNLPSTVCATLDYDFHSGTEYYENKLLELFQHVSTLTIQTSLVEIISDLDDEYRPPLPLLKSKCLTLNIGASFGLALPGIAHALASPMLETLVIKLDSNFPEEGYPYNYQDEMSDRLDYWNSIKSTSFTCLVSNLKTVVIIGLDEWDDNCEIVLEFIEYLLKNARVLEEMVVSLENSRKSFAIKVSHRILSFPRYSGCASVELLCSL